MKLFSLRIPAALVAVVVSSLVFLSVVQGRESGEPQREGEADPGGKRSKIAAAPRTDEEERFIKVYKSTNEATVFIQTVTVTIDPFTLFLEPGRRQTGMGSGIIIDAKKGIVLTNFHVISNANEVEISLGDGQNYRARVLGFDEEIDVAVLQMLKPPTRLVAVPFGDSTDLEVGQRVLAIGNPFGLNRTLTAGIVSSLDRTVKTPQGFVMHGLIQTDAAINPGNSGGPLLDMEGRLIGMNTAILSQSGDSAGIGFSVPINTVKRILPELIATGRVLRPSLGWILKDTEEGVLVYQTQPGGPADAAGVSPALRAVTDGFTRGFVRDFNRADLVVKINGKRIESTEDVDEILASASGRAPLLLTLKRGGFDGPEREVTVKPVLK